MIQLRGWKTLISVSVVNQVMVTMPWQKTVLVSVLEVAVTKTQAASIDIDLQGSTLKGELWNGKLLSSDPNCVLTVENGALDITEIQGFKGKSRFLELDMLTGTEGCSLVGCKLTMEACSVMGKGTLFLTSGSDVTMVDCEVTEAEQSGIIVTGSKLQAKRTKFVEHGVSGVEAKDKSSVQFDQCDFIGSRKKAGLAVSGKGTLGHVIKTTFINNETSSIVVSNGADVKVDDCVSFNSQTGSGLEAIGKATKVQLLQCEFLNSHLHGIHAAGGAQISADGTLCRGSVGCGLFAEGPGSRIQAVSCIFADNSLNGAAFISRAVGNLRGCTISGSKAGFGVEISGSGTDVTMISCKIVKNNSSGIMVQDEALGALRDCESSQSKTGCGLEVEGKGTEVWVTRGAYGDNPDGGVVVNEGRVVS